MAPEHRGWASCRLQLHLCAAADMKAGLKPVHHSCTFTGAGIYLHSWHLSILDFIAEGHPNRPNTDVHALKIPLLIR